MVVSHKLKSRKVGRNKKKHVFCIQVYKCANYHIFSKKRPPKLGDLYGRRGTRTPKPYGGGFQDR